MPEKIEATRAEAAMRSGETPLPELEDAPGKPKRKPLPDTVLAVPPTLEGDALSLLNAATLKMAQTILGARRLIF